MKKSKFLKKSLATLLALMLVVAMIPMSASAVAAGDGVISIEAETGTLTGSGTTFTDTVPWAAADQKEAKLTIVPDASKGFDQIVWNTTADPDTITTEDATNDVVELKNLTEDIEFYATKKADATVKSPVYEVKVVLTPASNDTSIKEVKIGEVKGVVDNTKKTITFDSLPWNATGSQTVTVTMNTPGNVDAVASLTMTDGEGTGTVKVTAQTGSTDTYTVKAKHSEGLTALAIGGVAAVKGEDGKYTVSLPVGTDTAEPLAVEFSCGTKLTKAVLNSKEVESGKSYDLSTMIDQEKDFVLTDESTGTKTYKVKVEVTKSDDTTISAFTATANGFTESGVIDGKNLTVELPYGKNIADSVALAFTVPTGAVASVIGESNLNTVNLTKPVTVKVVAADGKTIAYYTLTATVAKDPNKDPKINSAKVTVNEVEYTAVPNDKNEIIFTVPYSTKDADVTGIAKYVFSKTARTKLDASALDSIIVPTSKEITVESEAGDKVTYTVSFVKAKAEIGKELSKFTFTSAAKEEDVTSSNTYPVALDATKKTATVTLPYSYKTADGSISLVPQFTLSKGAKLYQNDTTNVGTALVSGFDSATPITLAVLKGSVKLIVADETAAFAIDNAASTAITGLDENNTVVYDVKVDYAAPAEGHTLNSFSVKNGITSRISGNAITITIPYTESIAPQIGHAFYADYSVSDRAVVTAEGKKLPATYDNTPNEGRLWYWNSTTSGASDLRLEVSDSAGAWTEVESIVVTNEAGTASTNYKVTVEVAPAETGAAITAAKVGVVNGTISGKNISATLPFGTDLTEVALNITASKMAKVEIGADVYDPADTEAVYDLTDPVTITVTSEDKNTVNVYTLTAKVAAQFSDVKEGTWYYDYVTKAAAAGIINGKGNGIFDPEGNITRGDFALMTVRMLGVDVSGYTTAPFSDVKASDYYMKAIAYCAEKGIIGGTGDGKFEPEKNILREEAAKIIAIALDLDGTTTEKFKDDAKISNWAKGYVDACKAAGIFGGDEKGNFNPKSPITRAETAKIMVVAMGK